MKKIAYLIHPVDTEKKRKYQEKGFKILDARFSSDAKEGDFVEKQTTKKDEA